VKNLPFVDHLREILARTGHSSDDFRIVAWTGESLRRLLVMREEGCFVAQAVLAEYDAALARYESPTLDDVRAYIDDGFERLDEHIAIETKDEVDLQDGPESLVAIDHALMVAAAGMRAGFFRKEDILSLSAEVATRFRERTAKCVELAQAAEDYQLVFGPDPLLPAEYYGWQEPLAALSPSRQSIISMVVYATDRQRRIEQAVSKYASRNG
jgi:hypothetical protein